MDRRFVRFHGTRHPRDLAEPKVSSFLTHLAVERNVSASAQNQALSAILFLYPTVLKQELDWLNDVVRARRPVRLPSCSPDPRLPRSWMRWTGPPG